MNNKINHLPNSDFEVEYPQVAFDYAGDTKAEPPVLGAVAVYFLSRGQSEVRWQHKGWLMPSV